MMKGKKHKIAVFVVMALLIGGMIYLVVNQKKVGDANDAGYHVADTTVYVPVTSE